MTLQCLRSMCAIYLVLLLYCMENMGLLFVLGVFSLLSSSFCVVYFSALLNAVIMLSCVYPRWISATSRWFSLLCNLSLSVIIRLYLSAWLYIMAFLHDWRWKELWCNMSVLSVGLMYRSDSSLSLGLM